MDAVILFTIRALCGLLRFWEQNINVILTISTTAVGTTVFLSVVLYQLIIVVINKRRNNQSEIPVEPGIFVDRSGQACPMRQDRSSTASKFMVKLRRKSNGDEEERLYENVDSFDRTKKGANYNDVIRLTVVNGPEYWQQNTENPHGYYGDSQATSTSTYQNLSEIRATYV